MTIENKELLDKAKELGIEVKEETTEEALKKTISDKEEENRLNEKDADALREEVRKYKEESKKAFEARDIAKKERRALQNKIAEMEDKIKNAPSVSEIEEYKKELKELKEFKEEVDKKREEEELKNKTDLEKAEARFKKEMEKFNAQLESIKTESKKEIEKIQAERDAALREAAAKNMYRLENEIRDAATSNRAINPKQIVKLLKDDFEYNKDLDKFEVIIRDSKGKVSGIETVEERVKKFLEDPDNDNLVESEVNTNSMHTQQTTTTTTNKYTSKDKDLIREADERGLSVERLIEIKKNRDAKLAKIRERKSQ